MLENRMLIDSEWEREYINYDTYDEFLKEKEDLRHQDEIEKRLLNED